jgi:hypothetical protein
VYTCQRAVYTCWWRRGRGCCSITGGCGVEGGGGGRICGMRLRKRASRAGAEKGLISFKKGGCGVCFGRGGVRGGASELACKVKPRLNPRRAVRHSPVRCRESTASRKKRQDRALSTPRTEHATHTGCSSGSKPGASGGMEAGRGWGCLSRGWLGACWGGLVCSRCLVPVCTGHCGCAQPLDSRVLLPG